jgi:competence protein ComEC
MRRLLVLLFSSMSLGLFSWSVGRGGHETQSWLRSDYTGPLAEMRAHFMGSLSGVTSDAQGLVAGLAIGDTSRLSEPTQETMKLVSLTHLTAVSGANCAIIIGAVYLILSRIPLRRAARVGLALLALIGYVLLVGPEPSVLRAGVMAAVVLFATILGRARAANQALALCVVILLVADPWLSESFGFQLSVLATLGILQLAPSLAASFKRKLPRWLALALAVSVAAQLACLPVLLQLQPGLSTYSVPANVLSEPLVAPITVLGIAACLVSPVLPFLSSLLSWFASLGAWLIIWIANYFADLPAATIDWPGGDLGILASVLAVTVFVAWARAKSSRLRLAAGLVIAILVAVILGSCSAQRYRAANWPPANWSAISCDVGQGDATVIRSLGQVAVIDVGRKVGPIRSCLNRLKITHIDYLVLTHFDLDHVGGLDGALSGRTVSAAIITSYSDERPAAAITWRKLLQHSNSLTQAEVGMTGSLGDFRWRVLSPHHGAPEAEDSNDGSVTMLFQSPGLILLTLADLGERGQRRLAAESSGWLGAGFGDVPIVVKVSHHGSSDQYPELYEALRPRVALFSVGVANSYGHPTARTLALLHSTGADIHRTDQEGGIAVSVTPEGLQVNSAGRG